MRWIVVLVAAAGLFLPSPAAAQDNNDEFGLNTPTVVVMDTSGSMDEVDGDSQTRRIDQARAQMLRVVHQLPDDTSYAMLSYPGGPEDQAGCASGVVRTPLGTLQRNAASAAISRMQPDGETPTGPALERAVRILEGAGFRRGTIVLVSDGESNCGEDPCTVAQRIVDKGFDLTVYPVGFRLPDSGAEDELACAAEVTGGEYINANDEEALGAALGNVAPSHLRLDVVAPSSLSVTTGNYDDGSASSSFSVTVTSDGRLPAHDVRVTFTAATSTGRPYVVSRPIRHLGNLAPGVNHAMTFQVRVDEDVPEASWRVMVVARNAAAQQADGTLEVTDSLDASSFGPLFDGVERVVVVGDSYSSGEGTGVYLDDSPGNCHRSGRAYAGWIFESMALQRACSGAVTSDFTGWQRSGGTREDPFYVEPQLKSLRDVVLGEHPPDMVFMSVGGNDAQFGPVAKACVLSPGCSRMGRDPAAAMTALGSGILNDVARTFGRVDAAVNDEAARAHRGGKTIPIVVVPYPRITPEKGAAADGCMLWTSSKEIDLLNDFADQVNGSVRTAVEAQRSNGRPFYFASSVVKAFQPENTICAGVNVSFANTDGWQTWRQQDPHLAPETLHPNSRGHQAEARAIRAWSLGAEAVPVDVRGSVHHDETVLQPRPSSPQLNLWGIPLEPEETHEVAASGFAPGGQVVVRMASVESTIGSLTADAEGRIDGVVTVPGSASAGRHELILVGFDSQGRFVRRTSTIRVWPRGSTAWLWAGALGLVLVAGASIGAMRRRQS